MADVLADLNLVVKPEKQPCIYMRGIFRKWLAKQKLSSIEQKFKDL
jgi:hypothetical protein